MPIKEPDAPDSDNLPVLVHGSGEQVVVFGPRAALERLGERVSELPGPMVRAATAAIASAASVADQGAQLSGAWMKLTPQAQRLLAAHEQAATTGGLLGFVRAGDGKIAGHLTFEHAGSAFAGAPALAGAAALQLQMAAIEQRLDTIQKDIGYLVKSRHIEIEAETAANLEILASVYDEVRATGELTESQWDRVVNIEASVRQVFNRAAAHLGAVQSALEKTEGSLVDRVRSLQQLINEDRTEHWLELYVHADRAVTEWELLHFNRQLDDHPERAEELASALRQRLLQRFEVIRDLANTIARLLDAEHDERFLDRLRVISRARLDRLLVELAEILYSYRQGVAEIEASNALALGLSDVQCEALAVLEQVPSNNDDAAIGGRSSVAQLIDRVDDVRRRIRIPRSNKHDEQV